MRLPAHRSTDRLLIRCRDRQGRCATGRPTSGSDRPSWLTFLGHAKDSLWSVDLFRCESLIVKTHWMMVVMEQFTRRIIGFAVQPGAVDGPALCRMFNEVITGAPTLPQHLSSDHDPLFEFHR
jgi:putative transposase